MPAPVRVLVALALVAGGLTGCGGGARGARGPETAAGPSESPAPAVSTLAAPAAPATPGGSPGAAGAADDGAATGADGRGAPPAGINVRYRFDGGLGGGVRDEGGQLPLRPLTAAGGGLSTVPRGGGLAVRFPARCAEYGSAGCPRAILESGPAAVLNPGRAPLRFGASILLRADDTSPGGNVLQKGYSVGDTQYKLQVDGAAGRPSCVMVGGSSHIYTAVSSVGIADGRWHSVECARSGGSLTVTVDGVNRGSVRLPTTLSVHNQDPLRIGGKGVSPNNDQFTGAVDDVFINIAAR
jgi:hypothetical protein